MSESVWWKNALNFEGVVAKYGGGEEDELLTSRSVGQMYEIKSRLRRELENRQSIILSYALE